MQRSLLSSYPTDKRNHRKQVKPKGSAHVAESQPVKAPTQQPAPQPVVQQSNQPHASNRGSNQRKRSSLHTRCRYNCPNCNEFHYAFSCSVFKRMPVTQRKEHVRTHSLCSSCLNPGHEPGDCRSRFTCHVCGEGHNTLIYLDASGQPQPLSGTANLVASTSISSLDKNKFMMTCQILVTGPTGKSMPVMALLDSGADISAITTKVAKHLCLEKLDTTMAVATYGDVVNETSCP